jgi:glycosyltransferase involved in cell wall biosynthesis
MTPAPPTVLWLLDHPDLGGGETGFVAFARAAMERPDALRLVAAVRGEGRLAEALRALGVATEIVDYPMRLRRGPLPVLGLDAVARLGALMDRLRLDIVHANNFFALAWGGRAARRRGLPVAWTCHGWWDLDNALKRWTARRLADRVLCVSEAVRREAERQLGGAARATTDYLGVGPFAPGETAEDRRRLRAVVRREMGVEPDRPLLAVVGRFQPIKGHALLFDAMPELVARRPGLRVWLVGDALFGSAEDAAEKARLMERARVAPWGASVQFLGWRDDARRLMRAVDALVVPSARESFCMAAVEGLEAGVAVVGPDGWGPAEIIDAPATGRRFRPGDAADLAAQIDAVLAPPPSGGADSGSGFDPDAGPRRVAERFSARAHLDRCLAVYRELLDDWKPARDSRPAQKTAPLE